MKQKDEINKKLENKRKLIHAQKIKKYENALIFIFNLILISISK